MKRFDTFWKRFWAIVIDGFILNIVLQVLEFFSISFFSTSAILLDLVLSNLPYLYSVLMLGKYGQTIGKMIMKVKVVDNATEDNLSYSQSFMREIVPMVLVTTSIILNLILFSDVDFKNFKVSTLGYILILFPSGMLVIWSTLEIVTMLFDDKNRALHDKIADTVVIRTDIK
jgi:uncharacterized RDD family membrane protein YckC